MMHRFKIVVLVIFMASGARVRAQWNDSIYLNTIGPPAVDVFDFDFISESEGMYSYSRFFSPSSGTGVYVKATTDMGNTWNFVYNQMQTGTATYKIQAVRNQHTFYHVRKATATLAERTGNNGVNWILNMIGWNGYYLDFYAVDTSHLFMLEGNFSATVFYLDKYVSGTLYPKIDTFITEVPGELFFPNADTGFITTSVVLGGGKHFIYKSTSGGTNFSKVFTDSSMNINNMFFISGTTGYAVGDAGKIIKTTNSGASWQYLNCGFTLDLNSTFFLNDTIGYVSGDDGLILKTIDGGISWIQQYAPTTADLRKVIFVNDSVGFVLARHGVYKTIQSPESSVSEITHPSAALMLYPNPCSNECSIRTPFRLKGASIAVYNFSGQQVVQIDAIDGFKKTLDVSKLSIGVYFVQLRNLGETYLAKLIISD